MLEEEEVTNEWEGKRMLGRKRLVSENASALKEKIERNLPV